MPSTKTRKSAEEETPLGFFEKFYAPHENPNWGQLTAQGLAQIIIDAERRRDEFQNRMAANSLPQEEEVQASRRAAVNMPNDRLKKRLSPEGAGALGGLDVLGENQYAEDAVSAGDASRHAASSITFQGHAVETPTKGAFSDAAAAEKFGRKLENIKSVGGTPLDWIDVLALASDGYRTIKDVGAAAVQNINPTSKEETIEYGAYIVPKGDWYVYQPPKAGTRYMAAMPPRPDNAVAIYHTHGATGSESFSRPNDIPSDIPAFLGTPKGKALYYEPETEKIYILGEDGEWSEHHPSKWDQ